MSETNPLGSTSEQEDNATSESVETNSSGKDTQSERHYTSAEMDLIVRDRLARERKKHLKEMAELEARAKESTGKKSNPNVEDDLRGKLTQFEQQNKTLAEQLNKYRSETLRSTVERELNAQDCYDPEVVIDHFLARNKVELDEDGNVVANNATGKVSDLVRDYLSAKPHLVKGGAKSGVGTKGPKAPVESQGDFSQMTVEQMEAQLGIPKSVRQFTNNRR